MEIAGHQEKQRKAAYRDHQDDESVAHILPPYQPVEKPGNDLWDKPLLERVKYGQF